MELDVVPEQQNILSTEDMIKKKGTFLLCYIRGQHRYINSAVPGL
jgi:hypothetical protein